MQPLTSTISGLQNRRRSTALRIAPKPCWRRRGHERSRGGNHTTRAARAAFRKPKSLLFCGAMPSNWKARSYRSEPGFPGKWWPRKPRTHCASIAAELDSAETKPRLEDLERRLTVAEEKLFAVLLAATPDDQIVAVRGEADRELAPYRSKMSATQIEQLQKQFVHKRLLEKYGLPRLSLFYMESL